MMPLDLWTLFVQYVFGNFFLAVLGIVLLIFVILMLGRISIYTATWYIIMFVLCMTIGYGVMLINVLISLSLIVAFAFTLTNYLHSNK